MAVEKIIVPQMGESINEVSLIKLYKKEGDLIRKGDTIADVATDKVDTELTSNFEGIIEKIFFTKTKAVISIGEVFALVNVDGDSLINKNTLNNNSKIIKDDAENKDEKKVNEIEQNATIIKSNEGAESSTNVIRKTEHNDEFVTKQQLKNTGLIKSKLKTPNKTIATSIEKHPESNNDKSNNEEINNKKQRIEVTHLSKHQNSLFFSPIVNQLIVGHRISFQELDYIKGTGENNRITKNDILEYLVKREDFLRLISENQSLVSDNGKVDQKTEQNFLKKHENKDSFSQNLNQEKIHAINNSNIYIHKVGQNQTIIPTEEATPKIQSIDRVRQMISKNLTQSKNTNVHVTSFAEIDMTNVVLWREKNKQEFEKQTNNKLTYTPIIAKGIIEALKAFPILNGHLQGEENLIYREDINIGIATALPDGNLIVPIIKKSQFLNLVNLATEINQLAQKARNKQLSLTEISEGTFTLTNIGTFNSLMGTPILPLYQSGILATGVIQKKPVIKKTDFGEVIVGRDMMFVSLSYDHRIIDGIVGGGFLNAFKNYIEGFDINQSF